MRKKPKAAAQSGAASGAGPPPPTEKAKPKFRISTTVKSIDGDNIVDTHMSDILARGADREDVREPDTPLTGGKTKAKPKAGFPNFRDARPMPLDHLDVPEHPMFNPDSITTPHTFAKITEPESPRSSSIGQKVFQFLRRNWDPRTNQFAFKTNAALVQGLGQDALTLCAEATKVFEAEPLLLRTPANIFVIGDIHGNYADLHYFMTELLLFNDIEMTPYSFLALGDYVDRGECSTECILLCFALKCLSPNTFFMLRGNHEDPGINGDTDTYGMDCFQAQARSLFGEELGQTVWQAVNGVFRVLPLAAIIDGRIFCSHGGIPRYYGGQDLDERVQLMESADFPRFRSLFEPLDMSVIGKERMEKFWVAAFDLMWSDPSEDDAEMNEYGFGRNDRGNCIITFSEVAVDNFLQANNLELMFRAHQEKSDGLKLSKSAKCLTIFSSSNYQGHGNGAGVVYVSTTGKIRMIMKEPT